MQNPIEIISIDMFALQRISWLAIGAFVVAMLCTPVLTSVLYKYKLGKKIREGRTPIFSLLHRGKENIPTMGGILVWFTVIILTITFNWTRSQTWLPLFTLFTAAILGLVDDLFNIRAIGPEGGGVRWRHKLLWQLAIAFIGAWWFYVKLGWSDPTIHAGVYLPAIGNLFIGWWYVPLFVVVIVGMSNAVNITDGLDGLAGGLLIMAYLAYTVIALTQGSFSLAAFCATVMGALLAFLWFNIYPARFFMGDTGSLALGATLGVIAMLTNTVFVLPVIASVFIIDMLSVVLQVGYRHLTGGGKLLRSAPLHHHFEAVGWPETKVTMRFWVIGAVSAIVGIMIALLGRGI